MSKNKRRNSLRFFSLFIAAMAWQVDAFQIAPMGSKFEARLTNESEARLAWVAGKVGVLLKGPIHEEITQIGFGCPANSTLLVSDDVRKGGDAGFVK